MTEKKMSEEQLEKVSGGTCREEREGVFVLSKKIEPEELDQYKFQEVAIMNQSGTVCIGYGTLIDTFINVIYGSVKVRRVVMNPHNSNLGNVEFSLDKNVPYLIDKYLK